MDFEIRYPNGDRVPLTVLDRESNEVWNIKFRDQKVFSPQDKTTFAVPLCFQGHDDEIDYTWYAMLGMAIKHPEVVGKEPMQPTWATVRETLFNSCNSGEWGISYTELFESVVKTMMYLKPYFQLIDSWESKGYKPIRTNKTNIEAQH